MSRLRRGAFACCQGKRAYATRAEAEAALAAMLDRPGTTDHKRLNVYHCGLCPNFHIGRRKVKGVPSWA